MTSYNSVKKAFKDIWTSHRHLQNWSSSSWWFFVFLPKQENGYGPKQMMFTYASRQGELIKVNSEWQPGFSLKRTVTKNQDRFWTTVVGWINDGNKVHEEIVHQPALATLLTEEQSLSAFVKNEDGHSYGACIKASGENEIGIDGYFVGKNGYAKFTTWGHPEYDENENLINRFELPEIYEFLGPAGGKMGNTQLVAWRKFNFKGEFKSPSGTEKLEGLGYFQRVLMNVPMPPWKWLYSIFEDGSLFSSFMIYMGIHAFRRDNKLSKKGLERRVFNIVPTGYLYDNNTKEVIYFNKATIEPTPREDGLVDFYIHVSNDEGDELYLFAKSNNHAQFLLDRRIIAKLWQSKFNYNEYMYEITKIHGRINGKPFSKKNHGRLWGNIEYVFGWSL